MLRTSYATYCFIRKWVCMEHITCLCFMQIYLREQNACEFLMNQYFMFSIGFALFLILKIFYSLLIYYLADSDITLLGYFAFPDASFEFISLSIWILSKNDTDNELSLRCVVVSSYKLCTLHFIYWFPTYNIRILCWKINFKLPFIVCLHL